MVLFRTSGQCPAQHFIDPQQGTCLSLEQVCANTMSLVKKAKDWVWQRQSDFVADTQKMASAEINAKPSWRCALSRSQLAAVKTLAQEHAQNINEFRILVLKKIPGAKGIHFFGWDGKPRTVAQIEWALCHYSTNAQKMERAFWILVSLAGLAMFTKSAWSFGLNNSETLHALWVLNTRGQNRPHGS